MLPVPDQAVVQNKSTFQRDQSLQTIYIYTQLSSDRLIKPGEFPLTEWLSRLCDYPVHDLDPVILVGMIVVLQGLELALHYFFCSKLKDRTVFF
jgi:hypothetical protein